MINESNRRMMVNIVASTLSDLGLVEIGANSGDAEAIVDALLALPRATGLMDDDCECEPLEPQVSGHPDNPEPTPNNIRSAYGNLVGWMNGVNALLPEGQRAMVPFSLQQVLRDYIDERETIAHLLGADVTRNA